MQNAAGGYWILADDVVSRGALWLPAGRTNIPRTAEDYRVLFNLAQRDKTAYRARNEFVCAVLPGNVHLQYHLDRLHASTEITVQVERDGWYLIFFCKFGMYMFSFFSSFPHSSS